MYAKTHRVYFDNQGVPFIILAQKNMDCHHGVDRQLVAKEKHKKYKSNQKVLKLLKFNWAAFINLITSFTSLPPNVDSMIWLWNSVWR